MKYFYDILYIILAIVYFPILVVKGKWHPGFKMRLGGIDPALVKKFEGHRQIWVHAVSVGEVLAVAGLIERLKESFTQEGIVCSVVTKAGYRLAQERLGSLCTMIYAPLDFSWVVRKYIKLIRPAIYISAETELWPNLYAALCRAGIKVVQVNGRISDRSFRRYILCRCLTRRILNCVDQFYMQSRLDAQRITQLGASETRVHVVGNLKFDNLALPGEIHKEALGFSDSDDLLIAGSTHPGEEEIIIDVFKILASDFPCLRLIVAPRHVERIGDVVKLAGRKGLRVVRFSRAQEKDKIDRTVIMVVDTIGHLTALYRLAKVVFIGKSLSVGGGQNVIEAACLGKAVIVGPLTQNFKDVIKIFLESNALIQVGNKEALLVKIRALLSDPREAERIGKAARQTVEQHQGAVARTAQAITALMAG